MFAPGCRNTIPPRKVGAIRIKGRTKLGDRASSQKTAAVILAERSPRIALIGCGAIAIEYYLPALLRHPSVLERLILVDRNEAQAQKLAAKLNVRSWVADYRQVLDDVDGVIVAVPTHLHHPIALEFLSRGVPVFCEKPLAESGDKARELVEQARRVGTVLAVNYMQRLIPSFAKVKEMLASDTLGEPLSICYSVGEEFKWPTVSGFYFNSPVTSRGVLRDRGAHAIDHICWWLGGKPRLIGSRNDSFGGSEAVAQVQFERGRCTGRLTLSWLATFPSTFKVTCEKGTVAGDVYDYSNIVLRTETGRNRRMTLQSKERTKIDIACKFLTNFIEVIQNGAEPLVAASQVLDSIEFIDECYAAVSRFEMPWYTTLEVPSVA